MNIRNVMRKDILKVSRNESVKDAMDVMVEHDVGSLLIDEGAEFGILTRKDIVNKVIAYGKDPSKIKVTEVFTFPVLTVSPDMSIKEAARLMAKANVKRFPVVEKGVLVGILSNSDILKSYA